MEFEAILQDIVDNAGGGIGAALMEADGIAIAEAQASESSGSAPDLGSAAIEFSRILGDIVKASDTIGGGAWSETVIRMARMTLIFQAVDADLLVVLALQPDGNLGKARYLIRRHLMAIREQL